MITGIALGLSAAGRYLTPDPVGRAVRGPSTLLVSLSAFLVIVLGWAALSMIGLAGWAFSPEQP